MSDPSLDESLTFVRDLVERGVASTSQRSELWAARNHGLVKTSPGPYGTYFYETTETYRRLAANPPAEDPAHD